MINEQKIIDFNMIEIFVIIKENLRKRYMIFYSVYHSYKSRKIN